MATITSSQAFEKKDYIAPKLVVKGDIAALTQAKTIGIGDGLILIIDGITPPDGVPIRNYS